MPGLFLFEFSLNAFYATSPSGLDDFKKVRQLWYFGFLSLPASRGLNLGFFGLLSSFIWASLGVLLPL